jgi:hypothetical protein
MLSHVCQQWESVFIEVESGEVKWYNLAQDLFFQDGAVSESTVHLSVMLRHHGEASCRGADCGDSLHRYFPVHVY